MTAPVSAAPSFAGLALDRPRLMAVINATPDSFSDGGEAFALEDALNRGRAFIAEGADILDVGGESTRPGATPVSAQEEIRRVVPVIEALAAEGGLVSIDSRRAEVMRAAVKAGARIINDVSALQGEGALDAAADLGVPVILMHMQGEPGTMQDNPTYDDVVAEVRDGLLARARACRNAGIAAQDIALDPGIGFGKTVAHNLSLLANLDRLTETGHPVVLGVSRKSYIAKIDRDVPPGERVAGSVATALAAWDRGVRIFRVHDVAEHRQALAVYRAIAETGGKGS
ncbi:dihydropteroate synthase [Thalassospiraceae bacterium LMO-SO8]|nr:dihydropteroate synthase [Alphaproteobacteria bacterium LMO-S08]WND75117.1 dihydropteroate synthase [Thalassospiraceae bacterium LMO-SO8]